MEAEWRCEECGRTGKHAARGLCKKCYERAYYAEHAGKKSERNKRYYAEHVEKERERHSRRMRNWLRELKIEVRVTLGGSCAACGAVDQLELHHVNGDGKSHRKETATRNDRQRASLIYRGALREGCPKDKYQLLCRKCHIQRHREMRQRGNHDTT